MRNRRYKQPAPPDAARFNVRMRLIAFGGTRSESSLTKQFVAAV